MLGEREYSEMINHNSIQFHLHFYLRVSCDPEWTNEQNLKSEFGERAGKPNHGIKEILWFNNNNRKGASNSLSSSRSNILSLSVSFAKWDKILLLPEHIVSYP